MTCAREGCNGAVTQPAHGRPRKYCGDVCRIAVAKGTAAPAAPPSWWVGLSREAFHLESVRRFPVEPIGLATRGWGENA